MKFFYGGTLILTLVIAACNNEAQLNTMNYVPVQCNYSPNVDSFDLATYVETWNSGDTLLIRSFYTANAYFFTDQEVIDLKNGLPYSAKITDPGFTDRLSEYSGLTMRIIGCPIAIFDKLVAFNFRMEDEREGFTGASIIRFENNKILLQVFAVNDNHTENQVYDSVYFTPVDLDTVFASWSAMDPVAALQYYDGEAAILADEDLLKVHWRDFTNPPSIDQSIPFYGDWNPVALSQPFRVGDLVLLAWKWNVFTYPLGHGVRILKYSHDKILMDVRYGIRPWEAQGQPF